MSIAPSSLSTIALRRTVAELTVGDEIRVTYSDGHTETGKVRKSGLSVLDPDDASQQLVLCLDVFPFQVIRDRHGMPGAGVTAIDGWSDDERFDRCMDAAQDYLRLYVEARDCPRSEQGWRDKAVEEAKAAFIAEFLRGEGK